MSLDQLRDYLENVNNLDEQEKKIIFKFWKTHGASILKIIEKPVSN